ncbi:multidrug ABC transporter permease/ATP-binding protein [Pigmentiphaga litoralis]|uniref:multidrug ABC transporter permease/ATP-binding protein n=1 Tax=Pigmentiphaga litoralis TaxID=516702 RepID=UPI001672683D|nr:multidrug ABC transporter permease/ATP-binding protein [Pigmentiphaga litoralis]GGW99378.1 multidrug ABC transporter permease/ATP-binding protein [Pigmentiphaga litoralis]
MRLIARIFRSYRWPVALVLILSTLSGLLSVGVIAFVNQQMIQRTDLSDATLWQFGGLLLLLLAVTSGTQLGLTALGHRFVYALRREMVKRLLDTELREVEGLGQGAVFASLSSDIRSVTLAFVHLPELIYGSVLSAASFAYLAWLSPSMFLATSAWMAFTLGIGWLLLSRLRRHLALLRESEDGLYGQYHAVLDGFKELALNRDRAQHLYEGDFDTFARGYRDHFIKADRFHGIASNWANIMVLGTLGLAFYLAKGLGWSDADTAATYALTLLFMRTPLVSAVAAIPAQMAGAVALAKVEALALAPFKAGFIRERPATGASPAGTVRLAGQWQTLSLQDVCFSYPPRQGDPGFAIGPLNITLRRGEMVFVIGGNGSGKSSLAKLLAGLYAPTAGQIVIDDSILATDHLAAYRQLFSAVFTDFHLFAHLLGPGGGAARQDRVNDWLEVLQMRDKVTLVGARIGNLKMSQGQRKRLALLASLLEERDILLLDEWAADQDPLYRRVFYLELLPRLKRAGITVIVVTHDDRYFAQADRLLKLERGRMIELMGVSRQRAGKDALAEIDGSCWSDREPG